MMSVSLKPVYNIKYNDVINLQKNISNEKYSHINAIAVTDQNFCKILKLKSWNFQILPFFHLKIATFPPQKIEAAGN